MCQDIKRHKEYIMNIYINGNKNLRCQKQKDFTVAPWTTQVWTAWVHLYKDFFSSKYYSAIWYDVGWICGYGTMDTE